MPRVKGGVKKTQKRNRARKHSRGYVLGRGTQYRQLVQNLHRAWVYAYRDRKNRKRDFRALWITRINAAARSHGMNYSSFINSLKKANVDINRKMLSEMATNDEKAFAALVELAKQQS